MREYSTLSFAARIAGIGLATGWSATAAFAACGTPAVGGGGSGPPSISVAEASTTQVLEQIRKRQQALEEQPQLVADASEAPPAEAPPAAEPPPAQQQSSQSAASSSAASSSAAAASSASSSAAASSGGGAAAPKKKAASSGYSGGYSGGSLKDDAIVYPSSGGRVRASWAQGFYDYEKHDDLAPGNQENPDRRSHTAGVVSGMDWTVSKGNSAYQIGVFSGYSHTDSDFSDTTLTGVAEVDAGGPTGDTANYARSNNEQEIKGPFIGAYASTARGPWTHDIAFKVDFFELDASSTLTQTCGNFANGNDGVLSDIGQQSGSADVTTFTVALGTQYRHDLTANSWIAPTFGIRYTNTDFSNDTSNTVFTDNRIPGGGVGDPGVAQPGTLGLDDGYSIRLQGGLRYGMDRRTAEGHLLTTTFGAFLYSDVLIEGFVGIAGQTGEIVSPVDEGKVRALGQFTSNLDTGNGWSYQFVGEVRGGEDLFGIGGQIGVRKEW